MLSDATDLEQRLYEELLQASPVSSQELADAVRVDLTVVEDALAKLVEQALVTRRPGAPVRYDARHPQEAFAPLVARQQEQLRTLMVSVEEYARRYTSSRRSSMSPDVVEVLTDPAELVPRYREMQQMAVHQFRVCDRPPYATDPDAPDDDVMAGLAAGVRYRVISDSRSRAFRTQEHWRSWAASGMEQREMRNVPLKLLITDERLAFLALDGEDAQLRTSLLVHPSLLLNGLIAVFETLWEVARPRASSREGLAQEGEVSEEDLALLSLLASGVTDALIARRLGVSERTLQRRIRKLMDELGVGNRFQAGLWASRRGWV